MARTSKRRTRYRHTPSYAAACFHDMSCSSGEAMWSFGCAVCTEEMALLIDVLSSATERGRL